MLPKWCWIFSSLMQVGNGTWFLDEPAKLSGLCPVCSGSGATLPWQSAWQSQKIIQKLEKSPKRPKIKEFPVLMWDVFFRAWEWHRMTIPKMRIRVSSNADRNHHRRTSEHWRPRRILSWHILPTLRSLKKNIQSFKGIYHPKPARVGLPGYLGLSDAPVSHLLQ